jgi:hypothetical protein
MNANSPSQHDSAPEPSPRKTPEQAEHDDEAYQAAMDLSLDNARFLKLVPAVLEELRLLDCGSDNASGGIEDRVKTARGKAYYEICLRLFRIARSDLTL